MAAIVIFIYDGITIDDPLQNSVLQLMFSKKSFPHGVYIDRLFFAPQPLASVADPCSIEGLQLSSKLHPAYGIFIVSHAFIICKKEVKFSDTNKFGWLITATSDTMMGKFVSINHLHMTHYNTNELHTQYYYP